MTEVTEIDGIGESTKKILDSKGIYSVEDFILDTDKIHDVIFNTTISSVKLAKIFAYIDIKGSTPENIDIMRERYGKEQKVLKNDKYIGKKIIDMQMDSEDKIATIITFDVGFNKYVVGNPNERYGHSLYTKEELLDLIKNQNRYKTILKERQDAKEKSERFEERLQKTREETIKQETIENTKCMIPEFTANMTAMKKGKVMQQLDKMIRCDGNIVTYKVMIFDEIMNKNGNIRIIMREYEEKKRNGTYAKLSKPKKELYVTSNDGNYLTSVNKSQYDYAEFLLTRR